MTREEAIKIISQMIKDEEGFLSDNTVEAHKMAIKALKQEPKTGHWIAHADGIWITHYECSECGKVHDTHSDYCPNCGAKMVEPQGSEENNGGNSN